MQEDGVLVVRMSGPLTGEALLHFKAEVVRLYGADIRGFVADYRGAMVAVSAAELDAVLDDGQDGSAPSMPAALLVRASDAPAFEAHAARMALLRIRRRVFVEPLAALAWVRQFVPQPQG